MKNAIENVLGFRNRLGVFSLSKRPDDELLWAHYAESHSGYCVEYDLERIRVEPRNQWSYLEVEYLELPPAISIADLVKAGDNDSKLITKLLGTKSKRWEYEEEFRILTTASGKNFHASEAITGIYFGVRLQDSARNEIRKAFHNRRVNFYEMHFGDLSYAMEIRKLPFDESLDGAVPNNEAPIEEFALPSEETKRRLVMPFVEQVRRDPDCIKIVAADVSTNDPTKVYVQFESRVRTPLYNVVNRYFPIDR